MMKQIKILPLASGLSRYNNNNNNRHIVTGDWVWNKVDSHIIYNLSFSDWALMCSGHSRTTWFLTHLTTYSCVIRQSNFTVIHLNLTNAYSTTPTVVWGPKGMEELLTNNTNIYIKSIWSKTRRAGIYHHGVKKKKKGFFSVVCWMLENNEKRRMDMNVWSLI